MLVQPEAQSTSYLASCPMKKTIAFFKTLLSRDSNGISEDDDLLYKESRKSSGRPPEINYRLHY